MPTRFIAFPMIVCVAAPLSSSASDKPDARLARVRTAYVMTVDELGDDKPVAACVTERLSSQTALTVASTRDEADVILRIKAHLPMADTFADGLKFWFVSNSATIEAQLPSGDTLWTGDARTGRLQQPHAVPCNLADHLLAELRQAMRNARKR